MDLIHPDHKLAVFAKHCKQLQMEAKTFNLNITCFATSIWDESLFKAWSSIVCSLLGDGRQLQTALDKLCKCCAADEIVLFESATLLFICNSTLKEVQDIYRFERIANIVKQFKLRCNRGRHLFQSMIVRNGSFRAWIGPFTRTTYCLCVISDKTIEMEAVQMNLNASKPLFAKLVSRRVDKETVQ